MSSPGSTGRQALRGFTLIEVLVALAVVAIALGAGLRAAGVMSDNAQRLADVTLAQWCAENQLTELQLQRTFPGVGDSPFECQQMGRSFTGSVVTRPTLNPFFRRVDAVVKGADGLVLISLSTVLGRQ